MTKIMIYQKIKQFDFLFKLDFFEIWYIDIYIDVYSYILFQMGSIQIDLGTCLERGT